MTYAHPRPSKTPELLDFFRLHQKQPKHVVEKSATFYLKAGAWDNSCELGENRQASFFSFFSFFSPAPNFL